MVLAPDVESAQQALEELKSWAGEAGFTLHPEKTRVVDMGESRAHFDFLGYRFLRTAKGKIIRLVRPKSKKELRESLKPILKRANGRSLEHLIRIINPKFRGWYAYFMQAQPNEHQEMDQWVRMRLRSILRKRHKGKGRGRGLVHFQWPNRYFEKLGLFSLERVRAEQMRLRKGATC